MLRTLGLFGITLVSYYDYERNITWGYFIGVIFLFIDALILLAKKHSYYLNDKNFFYGISILFMNYILFSSFIGSTHNDLDIMPQRAAFIVFALLITFSLYIYLQNDIAIIVKPLTIVLIIHLLFFYIQLFAVGVFSMQLDLIEPITGEPQRIFGGSYDAGLFSQFFRPAGLFAEPGTYTNMVFLIFILREVARNFGKPYTLESWKDIAIITATIVSLILSFSIFGFIFILVYFISILFKSKSKGSATVVVSAAILPFLGVVTLYLQQRFALGDESGTGFRYDAILILFQNMDWINMTVGWGFLSNFENIYYDITFNDLGLLFNVILQCGLIGLLLWSLFFTKIFQFNGAELALAVSLQLTKFTLTYPVIWLALILILNAARNHRVFLVEATQTRSNSSRQVNYGANKAS